MLEPLVNHQKYLNILETVENTVDKINRSYSFNSVKYNAVFKEYKLKTVFFDFDFFLDLNSEIISVGLNDAVFLKLYLKTDYRFKSSVISFLDWENELTCNIDYPVPATLLEDLMVTNTKLICHQIEIEIERGTTTDI